MGIDLNAAQLLLRAKRRGVRFARTATLGRQGLHASRPALLGLLGELGVAVPPSVERRLRDASQRFAEAFLELLGAETVTAVDASGYEGAQVVHDMNLPIPETLEGRFDVVIDGGTLEHVFDFPTGIRNAMRMVAPGGVLIVATISNNFAGHGFYQFSPELFFRLFCGENGYAVERCVLWEEVEGSPFWEVPDPDAIGRRIELTSRAGTFLWVEARRLAEVPPNHTPQQSDYGRLWQAASVPPAPGPGDAVRGALKRVPGLRALVLRLRGLRELDPRRAHRAEGEHDRRRLDRNTLGVLRPIEGMRVRL